MNKFFCADNSRQLQEDIIGTATNYQTYILVECPTPWT
ncbi:MAG: sucrase ferredoxin, partial [Dolichospermum sp.]